MESPLPLPAILPVRPLPAAAPQQRHPEGQGAQDEPLLLPRRTRRLLKLPGPAARPPEESDGHIDIRA